MNREILFKAKRKDNNEWVYGFLCKEKDEYYITEDTDQFYQVIPETISQYTGLKDKNGVKIFENDELKLKHYHYAKEKEYVTGKIIFDNGMFLVKGEILTSIFNAQVWSESIEIIGNIFYKEE